MTHAMRQWLAAAGGVALALLSSGSRAEPVVIDSPAWADLMALPLHPGEPVPFYAADLVESWGRPVEAIQLRRALLHLHLRLAGGQALPTGGHVSDVWQRARSQSTSDADLVAAHDAALNHSLVSEALASAAPGHGGPGFAPIGTLAPGFWADPKERRVGAHLQLRNTGPLSLAPPSLLLRLPAPAPAPARAPSLVLSCEPTRATRVMQAQQLSAWWCEAELPADSQTLQRLRAGQGPSLRPDQAKWASSALQDPASVREMAQALAGRPPVFLQSFAERNGACERQGTCVPMRSAPPSTDSVQRQLDRARAAEDDRKYRQDTRRNQGLATLLPWAYLLFGVTAYVLLARLFGVVAAVLLSLAQGPAMAYWYLHASGGIDDYLKLIVLLFLGSSGIYISASGHAIYKRFFANL